MSLELAFAFKQVKELVQTILPAPVFVNIAEVFEAANES
jgi:hypothetical protein